MKRLLTIAVALAALMCMAQTAQAEPENPIVRGTLDVAVNGGGKITGTGINCGSDCSDTASWRENETPPTNLLTATPNTGWAFSSWDNCPTSAGTAKCSAGYSEFGGDPVVANFVDVQVPNVFIDGYSPSANSTLHLNVTASDNDRIDRVEFLFDGAVIATRTSDYWNTAIDVSGIPEGVYKLQARAFDPTGNSGITAAWDVLIDRTGPEIHFNSPVEATNAATPRFSFGSDSDDFDGAHCAIQKQGQTDELTWCGRDDWYSEDTPTEGVWEFVVVGEDETGNETRKVHTFTVDRKAPVAAFTSGPADGSVVKVGNVTYGWNATDGLALTQECSWDSGEALLCDRTATRGLVAGTHTFRVVITDLAGNSTTLNRSVTAKKDGEIPGPDPDDTKAPVVKMIAPKQNLKQLRNALRLNVRCDESCAGKVVVKGKGGIAFSGRVNLASAGVAKLKLRPTSAVRKRLAKVTKRPLLLTATASLKDKAGNAGKGSLKLKVKS